MSQQSRHKNALSFSSKLLLLLLALFPVVPMPIAGGVPILITLLVCLVVMNIIRGELVYIENSVLIFLVLTVLLLIWESITALYHSTDKDLQFVLARGLWISVAFIVSVSCGPWVSRGRVDIFAKLLSLSILVLLVAMAMESAFYPTRDIGRQLGLINIPIPRATGVPNSDGKLGTFLVICFAFGLFVKHNVGKNYRVVLIVGPLLGLVFTQSRSTLLALTVTFGIYWVSSIFSKNNIKSAIFKITTILLAIIVVLYFSELILNSIVGEGIYRRNVFSRADHFHYGLAEFSNNPLFGSGANSLREFDDTSGIHNTIIGMSVKSGMLAAMLIGAIIIYPTWVFRKYKGVSSYTLACTCGILTEHMLYPGFINEFLIFSLLVPLAARNSIRRSSVNQNI